MVTRNEAELLRLNLAHHLAWGFDHAAIADNRSTDATRDVLLSFGDRVTSMTVEDPNDRFAALRTLVAEIELRHGTVSWVAQSDTDEFWWAPGETFAAVVSRAPERIMSIHSNQKLFLPTESDPTSGPVYGRMTFRTSGPNSPLHTSYRGGKSIYRGVWAREHEITSAHGCPRVPADQRAHTSGRLVHHYMIDGEDSFAQKVESLSRWGVRARLGAFKQEWRRIYDEGGEAAVREYYRTRYVISRDALPGHVERGELLRDTGFAEYMAARGMGSG